MWHKCVYVYLIILILGSKSTLADTRSLDFSNSNLRSSSTANINLATQKIEPPKHLLNWTNPSGTTANMELNFGDGSDGSFSPETYSQFGTVTDRSPGPGKIISINLSAKSTLNLSYFELASNDILQPEGNSPFIIRSIGAIKIYGIINCSGDDGQNSTAGALSTGGISRCGGAAGGNTATAGSSPSGQPAGMAGGTGAAAGNAGGGGGSRSTASASNGAGAVAAGTSQPDCGFSSNTGGAGGGGGITNAGTSGAGGGGGGGSIAVYGIHNIEFIGAGSILVNGGNGGTSSNGAGGGGGGGGGSVQIFAGNEIITSASTATYIAEAAGGTNSASPVGQRGGNGADGRTWAVDSLGSIGGINPDPLNCTSAGSAGAFGRQAEGDVRYKTGNYEFITKTIDLNNSHTVINNISQTLENDPASGTITTTANGSRNGFSSDSTGLLNITSPFSFNGSRYIYINFNLNNTSATTPTRISGLQIDYTPQAASEFDYQAQACGSINSNNKPNISIGLSILLLLIPVFFTFSLKKYYHRK